MLGLQVRRAFKRHGAADMKVRRVDLGLARSPSILSMSKSGASSAASVEAQRLGAEVLAQRPFVEHEADVEGRFQRGLDGGDLLVAEALVHKRVVAQACLEASSVPWPTA